MGSTHERSLNMQIFWWPHTLNCKVASVRLRCFNIIEALKKLNLNTHLYKIGDRPEVIVLSKRYDSSSIDHVKLLKEKYGTKIVLDLCDNHFYNQYKNEFLENRTNDLRKAVLTADFVVASSDELGKIIQKEFPDLQLKIVIIEDAVEPPYLPNWFIKYRHPLQAIQLYLLQQKLNKLNVCNLVWFGNHGSKNAEGGISDLNLIVDRLNALNTFSPISLTVISNNKSKFKEIKDKFKFPVFYLDWDLYTFSAAFKCHQICVIPISKNPFTLCKTNNRVATTFLHDVAVVATIIPSYEVFSDTVVNDWDEGLRELVINESHRTNLINKGKRVVSSNWTIELISKKWKNCFAMLEGE